LGERNRGIHPFQEDYVYKLGNEHNEENPFCPTPDLWEQSFGFHSVPKIKQLSGD
jgi:hypothetical protein